MSDAAASMSCCAPGTGMPALPPWTSRIAMSRWSRRRGSGATLRGTAIHLQLSQLPGRSRRAAPSGSSLCRRPPNNPLRGGRAIPWRRVHDRGHPRGSLRSRDPPCNARSVVLEERAGRARATARSDTQRRQSDRRPARQTRSMRRGAAVAHPDLLCDRHRHPRAGADSPPMRGKRASEVDLVYLGPLRS